MTTQPARRRRPPPSCPLTNLSAATSGSQWLIRGLGRTPMPLLQLSLACAPTPSSHERHALFTWCRPRPAPTGPRTTARAPPHETLSDQFRRPSGQLDDPL